MSSFTVLPKTHYLQFDCGVKVQLGFAAEFSNIMVIYTRILEKPKEIVSCCAQLTDFPEVCWLILLMQITQRYLFLPVMTHYACDLESFGVS